MSVYFERYAYTNQLIDEGPSPRLGMVVTIPCFDEPELTKCLASLAYCHPGRMDVEVIVVINHSENASKAAKERNRITYTEALDFSRLHNSKHLRFHIIFKELPSRHAGVGLARKIAMDEAARRLDWVNKP
ncbi:MAG: hypothetical protein AAF693_02735, partial [Bacteroidota bacterium]